MIKLKNIITEVTKPEVKFEKFADKRGDGAGKIVDNAKESGGLSLLTWEHFKVKLPYYEKAAKGKLEIGKAKEEYTTLLDQLQKSTTNGIQIDQIAFQKIIGKIEVLGELIIRDKETND